MYYCSDFLEFSIASQMEFNLGRRPKVPLYDLAIQVHHGKITLGY
jgi:hypothetical protein